MRKPYCAGDCDFKEYYYEQAGSGVNSYRGIPTKKERVAIPLEKSEKVVAHQHITERAPVKKGVPKRRIQKQKKLKKSKRPRKDIFD
jgi:hypothetical protein